MVCISVRVFKGLWDIFSSMTLTTPGQSHVNNSEFYGSLGSDSLKNAIEVRQLLDFKVEMLQDPKNKC